MKAIIQRGYGGADQVELGDVPEPVAGRGEVLVLVRVRAAAIDRGTCHLMAGLPLFLRPSFGLRRPLQPILLRSVLTARGTLGARRRRRRWAAISPAVDRTYPMSEAAGAIDHLVAGHARGKAARTV